MDSVLLATWAAVAVAFLAVILERLARWSDSRDHAAGQARLVLAESPTMSGNILTIRLSNYSQEPILWLKLEDVSLFGHHPGVTWRPPPTVVGNSTRANVVAPGDSLEVRVEFIDQAGSRQSLVPPFEYSAVYTFHDARGLKWSRRIEEQPRRVKPPWWKLWADHD